MKLSLIVSVGIVLSICLMTWIYFRDQEAVSLGPATVETSESRTVSRTDASHQVKVSPELPAEVPEAALKESNHGILKIHVVSNDGRTLTGTRFQALVSPALPESANRPKDAWKAYQKSTVVTDGEGEVRGLLLNQRYFVDLRPMPGTNHHAMWRMIDGPTDLETVAQVTLQVRDRSPMCVLRGRLIDSQGAALANQNFQTDLVALKGTRNFSVKPSSWTTDKDGGFEVTFWPGGEEGILHFIRPRLGLPAEGAFLEVWQHKARDYQIGDLPLTVEPILARGRVVDSENRGLAGVSVHCMLNFKQTDLEISGSVPTTLQALSDADGAFAFHGFTASESLGLAVAADGFEGQWKIIAVGSDALIFVLRQKSRLIARVQVAEVEPKKSLLILATKTGELTPRRLYFREGSLDARIDPGRYSLRLVNFDDRELSLWENHDLEVLPGATVDLGMIRPEGNLLPVSLALATDGESLPDQVSVRLRIYDEALGTPYYLKDLLVKDGRVAFEVSTLQLRIECLVLGLRREDFILERQSQVIDLLPGIPLRLSFQDPADLKSVEHLLPMILVPESGDRVSLQSSEVLDGEFYEFHLPSPGRYRIGFRGVTLDDNKQVIGFTEFHSDQFVEVEPNAPTKTIEVRLTADDLERMRKRMQPIPWK